MSRLEVIRGDITRLDVDAIVNAANPALLGGGGVDGAIHAASGHELLAACRAIPEVRPGVRCPPGEARITPGFRLRARWVIHTVGPVWKGGARGEVTLLSSCYRASLELAQQHGARTIAFPAISTGVYGFPSLIAASVAAHECAEFASGDATLERIVLVAFRELDHTYLRERVAEATRPPATRGDWKTEPLSEARAPLTVERTYTPLEFTRLKRGEVPREMEDRWFLFFEEPWLYAHRSWTGHCIFQVRFAENQAGATVVDAWVTQNPTYYANYDEKSATALLLQLLDGLARRPPR